MLSGPVGSRPAPSRARTAAVEHAVSRGICSVAPTDCGFLEAKAQSAMAWRSLSTRCHWPHHGTRTSSGVSAEVACSRTRRDPGAPLLLMHGSALRELDSAVYRLSSQGLPPRRWGPAVAEFLTWLASNAHVSASPPRHLSSTASCLALASPVTVSLAAVLGSRCRSVGRRNLAAIARWP